MSWHRYVFTYSYEMQLMQLQGYIHHSIVLRNGINPQSSRVVLILSHSYSGATRTRAAQLDAEAADVALHEGVECAAYAARLAALDGPEAAVDGAAVAASDGWRAGRRPLLPAADAAERQRPRRTQLGGRCALLRWAARAPALVFAPDIPSFAFAFSSTSTASVADVPSLTALAGTAPPIRVRVVFFLQRPLPKRYFPAPV